MRRKKRPATPLCDLPPELPKVSKRAWHYLTRRRGQEMLLALADDGTPIWAPHDLTQAVPYVITSLATAKEMKRIHRADEIIRCWYTHIAGSRIVF